MQNFISKSKTCTGLNLIRTGFERGFMLLSILFTLGMEQMWGATSTTVYYAVPAATVGCYTVKCNVNRKGDGDDWATYEMTKESGTYSGKIVYKATFTDLYNGLGVLQFQLYEGSTYKSQQQPISSWTGVSTYNGKLYEHDVAGWKTYTADAAYTVYFADRNDWGATIKAYAFNSGCDYNTAWGGADMTNTSKTYQGHKIYSISLSKRYTSVVFNCNGDDSKKTGDLSCYSNAGKMYYNGSWLTYRFDIALDQKGGSGGTTSVTGVVGSAMPSGQTAPTRTGYTFGGYYTAENGGGTCYYNASMVSQHNVATDTPNKLYAKWTANTYTVTLSYSTELHHGIVAGTEANSVTATYDADMPALTAAGKLPVGEASYYGFAGYFTEASGEGVKYYNCDGTSTRTWNIAENKTLHAWFKKPNIDVELSPSSTVNLSTEITATPSMDVKSISGAAIYCWRLLHSNGNPVTPAVTFTPGVGNSVTFTAPGTPGTYKLATILREGSVCGSGNVLDSIVTSIYVAPHHTVTIKYMCGDEVVKASTTMDGDPLNWTDVSAPTVTGYTFTTWAAGDGITLQSSDNTNPNKFKANYDGTLTAQYTRKKMIFLKNTLGWSQPYVYFYKSGGHWDANGAGSDGDKCLNHGTALTMSQLAGTDDIWYYDYTGQSWANQVTNEVAFTKISQVNYANFHTSSQEVIYGTSFSAGFSEGTPMFVPLSKSNQTADVVNTANYYSRGYWVDYLGSYAGYTLLIYNSAGNKELKRERFTSADKLMTMKATVDLGAGETYQYEVLRNDGIYCKNAETLSETNKGPKTLTTAGDKGRVQANAAGDYTFTLGYDKTQLLKISLETPVTTGDFRITYTDNDTWGRGVAHVAQTWILPSRAIKARKNGVDTISFFVSKGHSPQYRWQKVTAVAAGSVTWGTSSPNAGSWTNISVSESGVYNFRVVQNASKAITSITNIGKYTGDYYIRTDACNSKWDHYTTDPDNLMTYTEYSMSDDNPGDKYSHYNCQWSPRGTNIKFCIANDYSPCISDTLTKDVGNPFDNIDDYGFLKSDGAADPTRDKYSANVRFMWNETTNIIKRAYVGSATTPERQYLVLKGCDKAGYGAIKTSDGEDFGGDGEAVNKALFHDDQDFIYERIITVQPTVRAKVYASYVTTDLDKAQYFRGAYDSGNCGSTSNSVQIIGGSGKLYYKVRVIYDFKTNRLICAWMPNGEDVGDLDVDADVMVIRDHQLGAEAITFSEGGKLDDVKYVYGVMRFNRWTLSNRARGLAGADDQDPEHCRTPEAISTYHPVLSIAEQTSIYERALYFISFPFDVQLSEVFGLGQYGKHWIISEYNGKRRAQQGYFVDNCFNSDCTNWDYIWDRKGVTLEANKGYLLSLEIDSMLYDNNVFWVNNISQKELYFPSKEKMERITTTNVTIPSLSDDEYKCTINYNFDGSHPLQDRRVYDSYWRCIGTPSYAEYGAVIKKDNGSGADVRWQTNYTWRVDIKDFPFLYEWNVDDNSLSAQSTKNFRFQPMHSYLVQNGNAMYWTAVSATPSSIVRRQRRAIDEDGDYYWRVMLFRDGQPDDQTYVRMSTLEQVTDTFDFGQDLAKEFNYGHSDIYSYIGETRAAANSLQLNTETTTIIPLGVNIWSAGRHTITMPDGGDGVGVELVDLLTGERTNLSAGFRYGFEAEKGLIENRFQLEISPVKGTHTGIENVNVDNADNSKARKVLIDGALYIVRDGKLYDARGARVR